jgi:hypothetical protein
MVCILKQHLKQALSNEVSNLEKPFTDILYILCLAPKPEAYKGCSGEGVCIHLLPSNIVGCEHNIN